MHIETITHTGVVRTTGDLTGDARFVRVSLPAITVRIDPAEAAEDPIMWVEPLSSDIVVDAIVEHVREWLIAQR